MAEKRFVSRRLTESEKIRALANAGNDRACWMYAALMAYTDCEGRLNANPMLLKGGIFEGYQYTTTQIGGIIRDLARVGLVILYSSGHHEWLIQYTKFLTSDGGFNKPHPKEPPSTLPGPNDAGSSVWDGTTPGPETSGKDTGNVRGEVYVEVDVEAEGEQPADVDDADSAEARTMHALTTGRSDHRDAPLARAFFSRLIGNDNARHPQCRDNLTRWWQDFTEPEIRALWDAARQNPENKPRLYYFVDALNGLKPTTGINRRREGPTDEQVAAFFRDTN